MRRPVSLLLSSLTTSLALGSEACREAYNDTTASASLKTCAAQAEAGDADSQLGYGLVLWSGHGREARYKESIDWLRRAARQGNAIARSALGRFLTDPRAPTEVRNLSEGYAWWVAGGSTEAAADLRQRLSPAELALGEKLSNEFAAKYGSSQ